MRKKNKNESKLHISLAKSRLIYTYNDNLCFYFHLSFLSVCHVLRVRF